MNEFTDIHIECKSCKKEFIEEIEFYGYNYYRGICCPSCGQDIEILVNEDKNTTYLRFTGIDVEFQ